MKLRVTYASFEDLRADYSQQLSRAGLLVKVQPPAGVALFDDVELELVTSAGSLSIASKLVQSFPGVGVAVIFDRDVLAQIDGLMANCADVDDQPGAAARHEVVTDAAVEPEPASEPASDSETPASLVHAALHGGKDDRMRIMRGTNPTLQMYVLRNPHLGLDEVVAIARMPGVSADVIKAIADRRDWYQRPDVAVAIVRNPKSPVPIAIRMLEYVADAELRQIAKSQSTRMPILRAARKKVLGE